MRKLFIFTAMLLSSLGLYAQPRSESQALEVAKEFFSQKVSAHETALEVVPAQAIRDGIRKVSPKTSTSLSLGCYVINDEANGRFVIVSADERMYEILGYSEEGAFNPDDCPPGLLDLIDDFNQEYDAMVSGKMEIPARALEKASYATIEPFIKTKWDQQSPYFNKCPKDPKDTSTRCYTGCVATAMAQVMKYFGYPEHGMGSTSYTTDTYGIELSMDFETTTFNYSKMTNKYSSSSTTAQKDAVALLMRACGIATHMDYGGKKAGGSGTPHYRCAYALTEIFGYNPNIRYLLKADYSDEEWEEIIYDNLANKRPIIYEGRTDDEKSGHAFILHGYKSNKFYVNWGWGGTYDGYFKLTAMNTDNGKYNKRQGMICDISIEETGQPEPVFGLGSLTFSKDSYKTGTLGTATFTDFLLESFKYPVGYGKPFEGLIGIGVFDLDFNYIQSLRGYIFEKEEEDDYNLYTYYGISELSFDNINFAKSTFKEGSEFYFAPFCKLADSDQYVCIPTLGSESDYYLATVKDGYVYLKKMGRPEPLAGEYDYVAYPTIEGASYKLDYKVTITTDEEEPFKYWFDRIVWINISDDDSPHEGVIEDWEDIFGMPRKEGNNILPLYGILETSGNIRIPNNQCIFEKDGYRYLVKNLADENDILVMVNRTDSTMSIDKRWGVVKVNATDENDVKEYQYCDEATFKYHVEPPPVPTNINIERVFTIEPEKIYNLNGQEVSATRKGIFIVNGRKVVIK